MTDAEKELTRTLGHELRDIGKDIARNLAHSLRGKLGKAAEEEDERDAIAAADWASVVEAVRGPLESVARDGAEQALKAIGVEDEDILNQTFDEAVAWAKARAAELVGKSWNDEGELVDNPDADMAITDSLRDDLREAVSDAIEAGDSAADLGERIEGMANFSPDRAEMISQTEIQRAHNASHLLAFKASGVVDQKEWSVSGEDSVCDECQDNADQGPIDLDDDFESGDDAPPAHPGCLCVLTAYVEDESDEDEDNEDDESDSEDDDSDED